MYFYGEKLTLMVNLSLMFLSLASSQRNQNEEKDPNHVRRGKLFSLFNIVTFQQESCPLASDRTLSGTCLTGAECSNQGGSADGNCAAGFGACCAFILKGCGGQVSKNCTYFQNMEFPSSTTPSQNCIYNFNRIDNDLCQVRLDFIKFMIAQPPSTGLNLHGDCLNSGDSLVLTSPSQSNPPLACGTLTGQHMYLETGDTGSAGSAAITIGPLMGPRTYNVKVTFLKCDNLSKAPTDCVQYFTGVSGDFQSYNFQGGQLINNQNYVTCIRQEEGYCSIQYSEGASLTPPPFDLYLNQGFMVPEMPRLAEIDAPTCPTVVQFNGSPSGTGAHCGGVLNTIVDSTTPGLVKSEGTPFRVTTLFGNNLGVAAFPGPVAGYSLQYAQMPC